MNGFIWVAIMAAVAAVAAAAKNKGEPVKPSVPPDPSTPDPYTAPWPLPKPAPLGPSASVGVHGDSFGVGIAGTLPWRKDLVSNSAVVGRPSTAVQPLSDNVPMIRVLSAGTNDAAAGRTAAQVAAEVKRILGAFAGTSQGKVAVILPHDKMGGQLGERCRATASAIRSAVLELANPNVVAVPIRPSPAASDKIHFDPAGYRQIGTDALRALGETV